MKNRYGYVGNYIKTCREAAELSQARVGKTLKLSSPQSVSNWERGIAQPTDTHWLKLVSYLRMDVDKLKKAFLNDAKYRIDQKFKTVSK